MIQFNRYYVTPPVPPPPYVIGPAVSTRSGLVGIRTFYDRSGSFRPTLVPPVPVVPLPVLPISFDRPSWNPEKTVISNAPIGSYTIKVPISPVPPVYPDSYLRNVWNPDRSYYFRSPDVSEIPAHLFILSVYQSSVEINEGFNVKLTLSVPVSSRRVMDVRSIIPWSKPHTSTFSTPISVRVDGLGFTAVGREPTLTFPGNTRVFYWSGVSFVSGVYELGVTVVDADNNTYSELPFNTATGFSGPGIYTVTILVNGISS